LATRASAGVKAAGGSGGEGGSAPASVVVVQGAVVDVVVDEEVDVVAVGLGVVVPGRASGEVV
jgi:hypothetical protein